MNLLKFINNNKIISIILLIVIIIICVLAYNKIYYNRWIISEKTYNDIVKKEEKVPIKKEKKVSKELSEIEILKKEIEDLKKIYKSKPIYEKKIINKLEEHHI